MMTKAGIEIRRFVKAAQKHLLLSRKRNISKDWCNLQQFRLQWKIFKKSVDDIFESDVQVHDIRKFLSKELKFWYKRGSSRPVLSKKRTSKYLNAIFSSRMLLAIYNRSLIINVDESSYNRTVKSNYSWLPIGDSSPILNTNWTRRTTIIFGLISNGHWICMSINKTTNTKHFWILILLLSRLSKIYGKTRLPFLKLYLIMRASTWLLKQKECETIWDSKLIRFLHIHLSWRQWS